MNHVVATAVAGCRVEGAVAEAGERAPVEAGAQTARHPEVAAITLLTCFLHMRRTTTRACRGVERATRRTSQCSSRVATGDTRAVVAAQVIAFAGLAAIA